MNKNSLHRHRTLRRSATVVGGALMGMIAVLAFSTPALACHPEVKGSASCDENTGEWVLNWTVTKAGNGTAKLTNVVRTPAAPALTEIVEGKELTDRSPKVTETQRIPADKAQTSTSAKLTVTAKWLTQKGDTGTRTGEVRYGGPCKKKTAPTTAPTTRPTTAPTTAPTVAPTTPATPSPAAGNGGSLPVTGSSIGAAAGIAVGLLAIGAVLFYVFRRRRIRFTA